MNSKSIAFAAIMGTLGNALFLVSNLAPIAPGVTLDFSLVGVFVAALYGGPLVGLVAGAIAGVFPGIFYGPLSGNWIGLIGLPVGKALTGLTAGLLSKGFKMSQRQRGSILAVPMVLVSYVPEFLFTIVYFLVLFPYFLGFSGMFILLPIIPKSWAEIVVMSFLMAALNGNQGFSSYVKNFFAYHPLFKASTAKSGNLSKSQNTEE